MNIAFCHNFYQQPGGEDRVFWDESEMMQQAGHNVMTYTRDNDEISSLSKAQIATKTFWNREVLSDLASKFKTFKPDIVHFHNTFPLISPSAYQAAHRSGAAVIQSLHNYRWICPNGNLIYKGKICETCVKKTVALPAIYRKCYRNSAIATAVTTGMLAYHKTRKTLNKWVNRFIALTDFCKTKFVQGGFDPQKISVKQNFVSNPVVKNTKTVRPKNACFVGRLNDEKGVRFLLDAWREGKHDIVLNIAGDGPLKQKVKDAASETKNIVYHGQLDHHQTLDLIANATVQIVPSLYYEPFGLVVIEAFSAATPVIASRLGSLADLVSHEHDGMLFSANDQVDLNEKLIAFFSDSQQHESYQRNALQTFHSKFTKEKNLELLLSIYDQAIAERKIND
ncbi:glycosyltransferase [Pirellulaceae bacterium]|nr:glycosyltransferase [Pirellulaceae bacterium]MDB4412952.1 glycosyltransferase [Pirellulaceae bacterium]